MSVAVAMAGSTRRSLVRTLSKRVAARNRTWLRMFDELKLTAQQIADHVSHPLRTVQHGLKWARANPQSQDQTDDEAYDAKVTSRTLRAMEREHANSNDPVIREWLASLRRRN